METCINDAYIRVVYIKNSYIRDVQIKNACIKNVGTIKQIEIYL